MAAPQQRRARINNLAVVKGKNSGTLINVDTFNLVSVAAEEALIGAILHNPEYYHEIADRIQPTDFYILRLGCMWHAFERLAARGEAFDLLTIAHEAEGISEIMPKGDEMLQSLSMLMTKSPEPQHFAVYAQKVYEGATRCRMMQFFAGGVDLVADRTIPIDQTIDTINQMLFEASDQRGVHQTDIQSIASAYYDDLEASMKSGIVRGITTGFRDLDGLVGGFYPGEVTVFAGNAGMGKTTLLLSQVRNILKSGHHVSIFSLEMSKTEIFNGFLAMETGTPKSLYKSRALSDVQWSKSVASIGQMGNWPMNIIDEYPMLTPTQFRRELRKLAAFRAVEHVVIDGLWLMEADAPTDNRARDVFTIMRQLNEIARTFNVSICITHQYNRNVTDRKDKRPVMSDLAESAGVERNAQVILAMHRDDYYEYTEPGQVSASVGVGIYLLKDRNGTARKGQSVKLDFDSQHTAYTDWGYGDSRQGLFEVHPTGLPDAFGEINES